MSVESLTANVRHSRGKKANRLLRYQNKIPAILYGLGEMIALEMEEETTRRFISGLDGLHQLIPLRITDEEGKTTEHRVLIQEIQKHPYRRELFHLDFRKLDAEKPINLKVPLKTIGSSPGEEKGGIIQMVVREISITCLPSHIPRVLEVDVSNLDFHQTVRVQNVNCPDSVSINAKENYSVATIIGHKTTEEDE
jgi:large subunit ribosomal protein L25